jgi:hypothetical protein
MHVTRQLRSEGGSIAVIAALTIPLFLVFAALVIDVGNWYTHKRSLQNRADAAALAAGYEYLKTLPNCLADASDTGSGAVALTNVAKQYAGAAPGDYNSLNVNNQSKIEVGVNSQMTDPFGDFTDGANPCKPHTTGDAYSVNNSVWTDVKVREKDIGTLAGGFGLNLASVTAAARVDLRQVVGIRGAGLPFVNETGEQVDCAWAEFVDTATGNASDVTLLGGTPNPVPLTRDSTNPMRWTAPVGGIDFTSTDDIAVKYWLGTKMGGGCSYDPRGATALTGLSPEVPIDYINTFDNDTPADNAAPLLHHFELTSGTCGGPGYVYTTSMDPNATCVVHFRVQVDSGNNPSPSKITVSSSNGAIAPADAPGPGGTGEQDFLGVLTFKPNAVNPAASNAQSYTQVGRHLLSVKWTQTSGKVGAKNCTVASPCTGVFESGACTVTCDETLLHATYVADPLKSSPLKTAELTDGSGNPIANSYPADGPNVPPFAVELTLYGIDQQRAFIIRDSVQNTGNRSHAVDCGQGNGASDLDDAIVNGCPSPPPVGVNGRNDVCAPQPSPQGYRDCVVTVPGNKSTLNKSYDDRFSCTPNNWIDGVSPANLSDSDPRYAYIFLTSWGRIANAKPNGTDLPIRAFLRVYVTGWDSKSGACNSENDPAPEPYDGKGAVIWGHFIDVITLDDKVIVDDDACNLSADVLQCKPTLVR